MMINRAKRDIDWSALEDTFTLVQRTIDPKIPTPTIPINSSTWEPCHYRRVVIQPYRFMRIFWGYSRRTWDQSHGLQWSYE